ncbi:MAG: 1-deoxy-D-xylulose-5-phosphate reductoisomerase, partial [Bacteroidales bacterium]|nr:1-deoxy-D-xylulose-5-phosphate reductoisomerase [Bacteroidales bacterium]
MEKRRIAILGSTGSIGRQTLDVIREHPDRFEVELLTCKGSWGLMAAQAREFDANNVVVCDDTGYLPLSQALADTDTKVFAGMKSVCDLVASDR